MHPDHYKGRRTKGRLGVTQKVLLGVGGLVGAALIVLHAMQASEVNSVHREASARLHAAEQEIESVTLSLVHAKGALKTAREKLEAENTRAESAKAELENAYEKCENMRAELEAEHERELSDRTYDWKEEIYRKIKGMEDALSEQKAYWEAQLGPIRDQVTQLKDLLQGHRIDLAKTEVSRVMHRVLGNGKESEAAAFFLRIASLSYTVPFTVTPAVAERFNTHKGLWAISLTGEKKTLGTISEQLMAELPGEDVLGQRMPRSGKWGTCALVGNSGILKRYRLGKEIDLHDAIWRLDNAPVEGFEEFVGSHTTIRVVSDSAHVETRMRPSRETILQIIDTKETLEEFVRFKTEQRRDAVNVHMLSPEFMLHLSKFMRRSAPPGFYALALAMHKCRSIDMYGFAPSWRGHFAYRFWDSKEPDVDVFHQQGALRDPDGVDFVLMTELARLSPGGLAKVTEPCLTMFASFDACGREGDDPASAAVGEAACGAMPLSESAICSPGLPLPQPRPGFCADSPRKQVPANCFRRCPGKPGTTAAVQCAGDGATGPACDAVGIPPQQGTLVGVTCPSDSLGES